MIARAVAGWERFWFEPEETSTLALFRIVYGFVLLAWALTLTHDAYDFFSPAGVLTDPPSFSAADQHGIWTLLHPFPGKTAVVLVMTALILGAVALIVGFRTRLAAVVVFVAMVSLERRNIFVLNSGDALLRVLAFYLMLAPAGEALSLDRLRKAKDRFWEFPKRSPWVIRLLQIQLSLIYVSTVWAKVRGSSWNDGTAVSYAMRVEDIHRLPVPLTFADSQLVSNLATYGTLAIELSLGLLVWNRKLRPWVLLLGVGLHLGIDYSLRVGFFSYAVLTLYVAFIPPEQARAFVLAVRDRITARFVTRGGEKTAPTGSRLG